MRFLSTAWRGSAKGYRKGPSFRSVKNRGGQSLISPIMLLLIAVTRCIGFRVISSRIETSGLLICATKTLVQSFFHQIHRHLGPD